MSAVKVCESGSHCTRARPMTTTLDFNLHIYDMTAPRARNDRPGALLHDPATGHRTTMKVHKSIRGIADGWTVTDSHLSPDNERCHISITSKLLKLILVLPKRRMIYSSMVLSFCLCLVLAAY